MPSADEPVWTPDPTRAAGSQVARFARRISDRHGVDLPDYRALWQWSIDHLAEFWQEVRDLFEVDLGSPTAVLADDAMPGAVWFPGATLNYVSQVFAPADRDRRRRGHRGWRPHRDQLGRAGTPDGRLRRDPARSRRRARRPCRGLRAQRRRGARRVPGDCEHRRDLVLLRTRLRRVGSGHPARAARTTRPHRRRWLPLRRQDPRPARGGRRPRRAAPDGDRRRPHPAPRA